MPAWFVLSADAFVQSLTPEQRAALDTATDAAALGRVLETVSLAPAIVAAVSEAVRRLSPAGEPSPSGRRPATKTAPGIRSRVSSKASSRRRPATSRRRCARSGDRDSAIAFSRTGASTACRCCRVPPAVLVQRMVSPRAAGVAFGADPVTGRRGLAVVSAVLGFGTALVSGEADADPGWSIARARSSSGASWPSVACTWPTRRRRTASGQRTFQPRWRSSRR